MVQNGFAPWKTRSFDRVDKKYVYRITELLINKNSQL